MCAWCDRFCINGEWVEVEEAAARLELFRRSEQPQISHGICPDCSEMLLDCLGKAHWWRSLSFRVPMAKIGTPESPLRVAIVGAGPSGFYAAEHILKDEATSTPRSTSSTASPPPLAWSAAASRPTIRRSSR